MTAFRQLLLRGLLAGAILSGLLLLASCDSQTASDRPATSPRLPDQILHDFTVEMTRGEVRSATFTAGKGVIYRKRDSMIIETLQATLYDSDGAPSSRLWADSGLFRERKKRMIANGNVRVQSRDSTLLYSDSLFWYGEFAARDQTAPPAGSRPPADRYMVAKSNVHLITRDSIQLWTDTLLWNDDLQKIATDGFVTIERRGEDTLRGRGLRSDDQLRTVRILEKVSGRITEQPR